MTQFYHNALFSALKVKNLFITAERPLGEFPPNIIQQGIHPSNNILALLFGDLLLDLLQHNAIKCISVYQSRSLCTFLHGPTAFGSLTQIFTYLRVSCTPFGQQRRPINPSKATCLSVVQCRTAQRKQGHTSQRRTLLI